MIPKDPMILLSYINTQLRDHQTLQVIDHVYDAEQNRFRFIDNHGKKG